MKKKYSKPDAKAYAVMPCMPLAASPFSGTTEGLGNDNNFDWGTTNSENDDTETNDTEIKSIHPAAY